MPLIRGLFLEPDADAILRIPLHSSVLEDFFVWSKEKSGVYSVWSTYRSLVLKNQGDETVRHGTVASSSDNGSDKWKRLWKLSMVPKVRVF